MKKILKGADNFHTWHQKMMKQVKYRKAFEELGPEFQIVEDLIKQRIRNNFTQAQLAKKLGTKQPVISQLESGNFNPSVKFLKRIAKALNAELKISIKSIVK